MTTEEKELGWIQQDEIAISAPIHPDLLIPTAGFDEWYVFDTNNRTLTFRDQYVNFAAFNLQSETAEVRQFWADIDQNQPHSYLSGGFMLSIVSVDADFIAAIEKQFAV